MRYPIRTALVAVLTAITAAAAHAQEPSTPAMPSSIDLLSPMTQEASGTAWLPASTPMFGKMFMYPSGDMLMLHGAAMPRYTSAGSGSKRGSDRVDAPNWFMGMYTHPLGPKDQLGLRAMVSLDPLTEGGNGYPLLFQTGETWHGQPLHDRQHPHDLFSELSVDYSRLLRQNLSGYLYLGYPGEPALGPPTYMHRLIAYDLPDAPISHHWQDATHITFGVATAGLNLANRVRLEGSVFTGREPDENRYDFDQPRFDSQSGRLTFNPSANHSFQVSYGFVKNPEGDGTDVRRATASWIYNKPLGDDANFTTSLVWGRNDVTGGEGITDSYLGEADYQTGRHTFYTRLESIRKSGHELVLPEAYHDGKYTLGAYTLGYTYDLTHGKGIDTGIGAAFTLNTKPSSLDPIYGEDSAPTGFQIMFRFRPSRMKMGGGAMSGMKGMDQMSGKPEGKGTITAAITPDPPRAREKNTLTLTILDGDGKPVTGATIAASVEMTSMDMGTTHPAFKEQGDGKYIGDVEFSMPGPWRVTITATSPDGKKLTRSFDYKAVKS